MITLWFLFLDFIHDFPEVFIYINVRSLSFSICPLILLIQLTVKITVPLLRWISCELILLVFIVFISWFMMFSFLSELGYRFLLSDMVLFPQLFDWLFGVLRSVSFQTLYHTVGPRYRNINFIITVFNFNLWERSLNKWLRILSTNSVSFQSFKYLISFSLILLNVFIKRFLVH